MKSSTIAPILSPEFEGSLISCTRIASLWSDYGHIYRLSISREPGSLVLKSIHPPSVSKPSQSHLRKVLSYEVERWFYHNLSSRLPPTAKIAKSYVTPKDIDGNLLLEDLSLEYPFLADGGLRKDGTLAVLRWLAGFHACFFGIHKDKQIGTTLEFVPSPNILQEQGWEKGKRFSGLWRRGTYWYLETRREELEDCDEPWLDPWIEKVNSAIDQEINTYGTLIHGDVKGANIVFNRSPHSSSRGSRVSQNVSNQDAPLSCALYDLQYVGLGLPVHDLVYFLGTSIHPSLLSSASEEELLDFYHTSFVGIIPGATPSYPFDTFLRHWELALVDWYRFMAGWGFWGNHSWVERRVKEIVKKWENDSTSWTF